MKIKFGATCAILAVFTTRDTMAVSLDACHMDHSQTSILSQDIEVSPVMSLAQMGAIGEKSKGPNVTIIDASRSLYGGVCGG